MADDQRYYGPVRPLRLTLLETCLSTLGEREVTGPKSNPTILAWIRARLPWAKDDSTTAWCGLWLAAMCQHAQLPIPEKAWKAAAWKDWGHVRAPIAALPGDVAILTRPGGHHVGAVLKVTRHQIWLLGGNQGNAVSVRSYPFSRVQSVRSI